MAGSDPLSAATTGAIAGLGVLTDPNLKSDLSPPAAALAKALDEGMGAALFGRSLSSAGADALAGLAGDVAGALGENAAEIIGDVASSVPLVGTVVKVAVSIVNAALAPFSAAAQAEHCAQLAQTLTPQATGSMLGGGRVVPADIFAPSFEAADCRDGYNRVRTPSAKVAQVVASCTGGPLRVRSLFGMVLMQITEGTVVDVSDPGWDWDRLKADVLAAHPTAKIFQTRSTRGIWERAVSRDVRLALRTYREKRDHILDDAGDTWREKGILEDPLAPLAPLGLPPAWRVRFRGLRRGIEAAWGPGLAQGAASDGGVGLWVLYADLLTEAFRRGYLSPYYACYLLARQARQGTYAGALNPQFTWDRLVAAETDEELVRVIDVPAAPPTHVFGPEFAGPCPPMLVSSMVLPLVRGWADTVRPHYVQGQTEIRRIEKAANPGVPWWAWVLGALGIGAIGAGAAWAAKRTTPVVPQLPKDFEARYARRM